MPLSNSRDIFAKRLKHARKLRNLTQVELGVKIGLNEGVASARISRYELGMHEPELAISKHLANALNLPLPYFFTEDEALASFLMNLYELSADQQLAALTLFTRKLDSFRELSLD